MKSNKGLGAGSLEDKLIEQMREKDSMELPMDDMFFDKLHDKIMSEVVKTEVKPLNRWAKTWVFLEHSVRYHKPSNNMKSLRVVKMALFAASAALSVALGSHSLALFQKSAEFQLAQNQQVIINEALLNPQDWVELAATMQNEADFYSEVVNQKLTLEQANDLKL